MILPTKLNNLAKIEGLTGYREVRDYFHKIGCNDFDMMSNKQGNVVLFTYNYWRFAKPDVIERVSMANIDKRLIKRNILNDKDCNFVDYITIVKFRENHKFYDLIVDVDYIHIYDYEGEL